MHPLAIYQNLGDMMHFMCQQYQIVSRFVTHILCKFRAGFYYLKFLFILRQAANYSRFSETKWRLKNLFDFIQDFIR